MGIGYSVSALSSIHRLDLPHMRPGRSGPSDPDVVLTWRNGIGVKYRAQLGRPLEWDERSPFQLSEDGYSASDVAFATAAAALDMFGPAGAATFLQSLRLDASGRDRRNMLLTAASGRGFAGRFPQLLLCTRIWLPFEPNLIIEEPDWDGKPRRFGSLHRLLDEVDEVRAFVRALDPTSVRWTNDTPPTEILLHAAWQAGDVMHRIGSRATVENLPFWASS